MRPDAWVCLRALVLVPAPMRVLVPVLAFVTVLVLVPVAWCCVVWYEVGCGAVGWVGRGGSGAWCGAGGVWCGVVEWG